MAKLGNKPIEIPKNVEVTIKDDRIIVKGPKGTLERSIPKELEILIEDTKIRVLRKTETKFAFQIQGTIRQLINNMIIGVTQGFKKELKMEGTGYRAKQEGDKIILTLGFSHPVILHQVEGVEIKVEGTDKIIVSGIDKEKVGQVAAKIRDIKPPDPYKGKGIRYADEVVKLKPGKAGVKGK